MRSLIASPITTSWNIEYSEYRCEPENDYLEQIACTNFRSLFLGNKLEEKEVLRLGKNGFKLQTIEELSENIICGKTPPTKCAKYYGAYLPFITIPDMHRSIINVVTERSLSETGVASQPAKTLPRDSICVSCIATPGLVVITTTPSQTNQQINSIICQKGVSPYYMLLAMTDLSDYIVRLGGGGSATLNLNKRQFSQILLPTIPNDTMGDFHRTVKPLFLSMEKNQNENRMLSNLRNLLLPKLMSGEIDVSRVEI
jgi:type I restriction enzyme S subunit